jgi:phosphoribosylaminoimidazolecarboxamide formyltransferase/IMP cyclohydrolase
VEEIDVGGPTMIRAAAKNFAAVGVVVSPTDYPSVVEELQKTGELSLATRAELARKAFAVTSGYDAVITRTLEEFQAVEGDLERSIPTGLPRSLFLGGHKALDLRYGENPHQQAAFYRTTVYADQAPGLGGARQHQGKELSYNNLLDLDAAWGLAREFWQPFGGNPHGDPVAVIIKHTNPCGTAVAASQREAFEKALACDPVSAFGSVLGFNQPVTKNTAEAVSKLFVEAIAAPGYDKAALEVLETKRNLRVLEMPVEEDTGWRVRSVAGGLLVQDRDIAELDPDTLRTMTRRAPTEEELEQLLFAWVVCKHVKSNAIVYARQGQTVGVGAGQMSRVDSVKLAAQKARELGHGAKLEGSVLASDAFFPFPDGVEEAAKAGVTAVIQPGGSKRDNEVIEAANRLNLAMVFTGVRHFRH